MERCIMIDSILEEDFDPCLLVATPSCNFLWPTFDDDTIDYLKDFLTILPIPSSIHAFRRHAFFIHLDEANCHIV